MGRGRMGTWMRLVGLAVLTLGSLQAAEPPAPDQGPAKLPPTMARSVLPPARRRSRSPETIPTCCPVYTSSGSI